jgi:SAM-dependent methyltransferase
MQSIASDITYLSQPESVSMGDAWFSIATTKHFWIRRRFQVLQKLAQDFPWRTARLAEIGCGSGLVQRQVEEAHGVTVDGFDLNELALKQSVCETSRRFCYNIFNREASLEAAYDGVLLFDVIEHIDDHRSFLEAANFHLKPGGRLFINVPADPALFSNYDKAAGHVRRYLAEDLISLVESLGMKVPAWTYWGKPLRPLLSLRKRRLQNVADEDEVLREGFSPRSAFVNMGLWMLSQLERVPQHSSGASLMLIAQR